MSKLQGLKSDGKNYTIGGVEFYLTPLGLDDFELFDLSDNSTNAQYLEAIIKLIKKATVQDNDLKDVTDEEIKKFVKLDHIQKFQEAILDVCGMNKEQSGSNRTQMIRDKINALKQARQAQSA